MTYSPKPNCYPAYCTEQEPCPRHELAFVPMTSEALEAETLEWYAETLAAEAEMEFDAYYEGDLISQGYYDDDPSPYNGDYSEM